MTRHQSPHFVLEQTEDGWMLESQHITKDGQGDWMLNHDQLEELATLLQQSLAQGRRPGEVGQQLND